MYLEYYRLNEFPFSISPNPRFVYFSKRHQEAFSYLVYSIRSGEGFVVLTGEVGTGKTTISRRLFDQLPEHIDLAHIFNPGLSAPELFSAICTELRIPHPSPADGLGGLVDALNRHLLSNHARGRKTVVTIDEAQNLGPELLEKIRLLTNLETNTSKLLQIILIGQPELNEILARSELRQLSQRITARYHILPLEMDETAEYVAHRLRLAGCSSPIFTPAALRVVHRKAHGTPRLINKICDRALLGGYARKQERILPSLVRQAAREVSDTGYVKSSRRPLYLAAAGVALGLVAWMTFPIILQALPLSLLDWGKLEQVVGVGEQSEPQALAIDAQAPPVKEEPAVESASVSAQKSPVVEEPAAKPALAPVAKVAVAQKPPVVEEPAAKPALAPVAEVAAAQKSPVVEEPAAKPALVPVAEVAAAQKSPVVEEPTAKPALAPVAEVAVAQKPPVGEVSAVSAENGVGSALVKESSGTVADGKRLSAILERQDIGSTAKRAGEVVARLWNLPDSALNVARCKGGGVSSLTCIRQFGNWENIRKMDFPVVLVLLTSDGQTHYGVLTGLGQDWGLLEFGVAKLLLPLAEIGSLWFGEYLLWGETPVSERLSIGSNQDEVVLLRRLLSRALGEELSVERTPKVFDAQLRVQVLQYQKSVDLPSDGVVGPLTWMMLASGDNRSNGKPRPHLQAVIPSEMPFWTLEPIGEVQVLSLSAKPGEVVKRKPEGDAAAPQKRNSKRNKAVAPKRPLLEDEAKGASELKDDTTQIRNNTSEQGRNNE